MMYLFLTIFWLGIFILKSGKHHIRRRAAALIGKTKEKSAFYRFLAGKKYELLKEKYDTELSECIAYIRNVAILGQNSDVSILSLLGDLAEISDKLKPAFLEMARYLNTNDKQSAALCLENLLGPGLGADLGRFIAGWDDIPPSDIKQTLDAYQSTLRQERTTKRKQRDELISDLIYFPVVLNCMAIMLNFIYVGYFIEQENALSLFF